MTLRKTDIKTPTPNGSGWPDAKVLVPRAAWPAEASAQAHPPVPRNFPLEAGAVGGGAPAAPQVEASTAGGLRPEPEARLVGRGSSALGPGQETFASQDDWIGKRGGNTFT